MADLISSPSFVMVRIGASANYRLGASAPNSYMIYLKHSIHGTKIAALELEAAHDEQHGWVRCDLSTMNASRAILTDTPSVGYNKLIPAVASAVPPKKVK